MATDEKGQMGKRAKEKKKIKVLMEKRAKGKKTKGQKDQR